MHRWLAIFPIGAAILFRPAPAAPMTAAAAGRPIPLPPILQQDARFGKEVTLQLRKSPLSTVAAELGQQVGVTLTTTPEVADEPAIVYVTAQPARQVMQHLAALFNFRWRRHSKPGEQGYELYQDVKSRQEEEALRQQEVARALGGLRQAIRERLDLAQRSPEELNKAADAATAEEAAIDASLKTASAASSAAAGRRSAALDAAADRLRTMADPVQRALIHVAAALHPEQWEALAAGKPLLFSTRSEEGMLPLTSALSQELREARPKAGDPSIHYRHDSPQDEALFNQMEAELQNGWSRADAIRVNVWLDVTPRPFGMLDWHGRPGEAPSRQATLSVVPVPQIPPGPHTGFVLKYTGLKVNGNEAPFSLDEGEKRADRKPGTDADAGAEASQARDPILGIKRSFPLEVKFADPDFGWARFQFLNEVLPRIAETYGINLVADAYRQRFPMVLPPSSKEERTLTAVLDQYIRPRARWSREGEFIHVRRWTWYDDRLAEIPERVVKYWAEYLRKQPSLSLDDAGALVLALRDEQLGSFEETMRDEGVLLKDAHLVPESGLFFQSVLKNSELLRAYASLSGLQRQSLAAGKPVTYAAMPPEARAWLRAAMARRLRLRPDSYSGGLPAFLPAVINGEPPQSLTLSRFRLQDGSAPGGSFEQINLDAEYGAEDRRAQFIFIAPRVALERRPHDAPVGTARNERRGGPR